MKIFYLRIFLQVRYGYTHKKIFSPELFLFSAFDPCISRGRFFGLIFGCKKLTNTQYSKLCCFCSVKLEFCYDCKCKCYPLKYHWQPLCQSHLPPCKEAQISLLLNLKHHITPDQHFHWLAGHRLSAHIPAIPNMVNEHISKWRKLDKKFP